MSKIKALFTDIRMIVFILAILLSLLAIHPGFDHDGVAIRGVAKGSAAYLAGIESPGAAIQPMKREVIISINNEKVTDEASYHEIVAKIKAEQPVTIKTNKETYYFQAQAITKVTYLDEYETITEEVFNETSNKTTTVSKEVQKNITEIIGTEDIGLTVYSRPKNNIRKGLDLEGGTRVLLEPEQKVSDDEIELIINNIKQRLNVYGVNDINVVPTKDFDGNTYISVELAGVNKDEVRELLSQQGKFEAKVGTETVFVGGEENIKDVCRRPECSGLDRQRGCGKISDSEWACAFYFQITLSPEAAARQAAATEKLDVIMSTAGEGYLSENLSLYLDDELVDQLRIAEGLKGSEVTAIQITGSGTGTSQAEAEQSMLKEMNNLQTILMTGSLPVKLNIVKTDAISPVLGQSFIKNVMLVGLLSMLAVTAVIVTRYKKWQITIPMIIVMISEVVITLGIAALIGWRLDLSAIAGIIIAVGTGVNDQIVIADEALNKDRKEQLSWKSRIERAFFIIMAAYFTMLVAMLPLWFAGAGLLKGFALTTILAISVGVFITRPVYAKMFDTIMN
jgi:preprotein translocase subunit SecD